LVVSCSPNRPKTLRSIKDFAIVGAEGEGLELPFCFADFHVFLPKPAENGILTFCIIRINCIICFLVCLSCGRLSVALEVAL
jgi:hypothetical protein